MPVSFLAVGSKDDLGAGNKNDHRGREGVRDKRAQDYASYPLSDSVPIVGANDFDISHGDKKWLHLGWMAAVAHPMVHGFTSYCFEQYP
jgi:hypothetical protein